MKKQFEIGIDHPMLKAAKSSFDTCLRAAVTKAIATGMDEGSSTLKISFQILNALDNDTGEYKRIPEMKFKAAYSVPMKESVEATIGDKAELHRTEEGYMLITGQVSMDELLEEEE